MYRTLIGRLTALAAALCTVLAIGGGASVAAPTADLIVFTTASWIPGRPVDLWTIRPDGRGLRRLHVAAADFEDPAWSPDGERITFTFSRKRGVFPDRIAVVPAAGRVSTLRAIGLKAITDPVWSPDGRWIAFVSWAKTEPGHPGRKPPPRRLEGVYVVHPNGTGLRMITTPAPYYSEIAWAPTSTRLVVVRDAAEAKRCSAVLVVARVAGGSGPLPACGFGPVWSPSGDRIVYSSDAFGFGEDGLRSIAPGGGGRQRLTAGFDLAPSFSPDGNRLVFIRQAQDLTNARSLMTLDLRTRREQRITPRGFEVGVPGDDLRWSPDGTTILFSRRYDRSPPAVCGLWTVRAEGSVPRRFVTGTTCGADWRPRPPR